MIYTLKHEMMSPEHEKVFGKWGEAPPNWREVTPVEFYNKGIYRTHTPIAIEYRQWQQDGKFMDAQLYIYHDHTGYAMQWGAKWREHDNIDVAVHIYLFGCDHTYKETSRPSGHRSGIHTVECTKCGYKTGYDTSD